ncbi:MAG: polysaccharide deacetylase family protein [Nanoarchaeota archaeon]|nr:polysaccharide deacetylase family protein [Nanoarchaeota archaeon]
MYWLTKVYTFGRFGSNLYFHGSRKSNRIALTFDDGLSDQTNKILRILDKNKCRGTFFLVGERISGKKEIVRKIVTKGHEVGNHSYSHKNLLFKSQKTIEEEIALTEAEFSKLDVKTSLFRPPDGSFGLNLIKIISKKKLKAILWDVDPQDWKCNYDIGKIVNYILGHVRGGSIIDLHDYAIGVGENSKLVELLRRVVPLLKEEGYEMVTVGELFGF